jgi:hypothetical protein
MRAVAVVVLMSGLLACGADDDEPRSITVSAGSSIQEAVDRADDGDLVLIEPGVYHESVEVDTAGIVIRGADRNDVVLEGRDELENGITVRADGVAVENLTVRGYRANGVLFVGELDQRGASGDSYGASPTSRQLRGYRASYVTAHDNGLYGLYAFASEQGIFEHSYVAGHADAGVYIGQCKPCDALVRDVVGERNAVGYQAINASGVTVVGSVWRDNRVGVEVGSQDIERLAPQSGHQIVGNLVVANDDPGAPGDPSMGFGVGVAIVGGTDDVVERNRISDHDVAGLVVTDDSGFVPRDNIVRSNVFTGNTVDLVFALTDQDADGAGSNCFERNEAATASPASLLADGCAGETAAAPTLVAAPPPPTVTVEVREVERYDGMSATQLSSWSDATEIDTTVDLTDVPVPDDA